ncbi:MAG: transcriptional repressor [Cohaesibacteraceae bacterium]
MSMAATADLTRNNRLVLDALTSAGGPLSAYQLLDQLRDQGLRAPPQIYRALKWLAQRGLVHKLESTNAYIACAHAKCCGGHVAARGPTVFFLCAACGHVKEVADDVIAMAVASEAQTLGFVPDASVLEVHGTCASCLSAGAA